MKGNGSNEEGRSGGGKSLKILGVLVVVVAIGLAVVWLRVVRAGESNVSEMATAIVERGPLTISVLGDRDDQVSRSAHHQERGGGQDDHRLAYS